VGVASLAFFEKVYISVVYYQYVQTYEKIMLWVCGSHCNKV